MYYSTLFLCFAFILQSAFGQTQTQNVQIFAPPTFKLNKDLLKIDCQPVAGRFSQVNNIDLKRTTSTVSSQTIAAVRYDRTQGSITTLTPNTDLSNRATVTGTVDSVAQAQLSLTIPFQNTQCSDEGIYTCFVSGENVDTTGSGVTTALTGEVSQNVSVIVEPDGMERMTASPLPAVGGQYKVGVNITLSCKGTVGSYQNPLSIVWCIERTTNSAPVPVTDTQISQSEVQPTAPGSCQYFRTSTMLYTVTEKDTFTKFICQITRRSAPDSERICGVGTYNSSLNIETVKSTTPTPSGQGGDAVTNAGAIAGGVIGGLAFVILVVLLVYFCFIRKKNEGETYNTREDKTGKVTNMTNVTSEPVYSQPNKKKGFDNAAMDEPPAKPRHEKRDRHRNDRHDHQNDGRGHANPAMYDHDDYDRDGTPEPRGGGVPMGSAV